MGGSLLVELFAVGSSAFLGVFVRHALDYGFTKDSTDYSTTGYWSLMHVMHEQSFVASNIVGCLLMGLCLANSSGITRLGGVALYKSLTVGLCGSITTFSSWTSIFAVDLQAPQSYGIFFAVALEMGLFWSSLLLGIAVSELVWYVIEQIVFIFSKRQLYDIIFHDKMGDNESEQKKQLELPPLKSGASTLAYRTDEAVAGEDGVERPQRTKGPSLELLIWGSIFSLGVIVLWSLVVADSIAPSSLFRPASSPGQSRQVTGVYRVGLRSVALAPCGALLRWALSKVPQLTDSVPSLHLHTLLANSLGVLLLMVSRTFVVGSSSSDAADAWALAVNTGVAGSLSTVSSFLVELRTLYNKPPSPDLQSLQTPPSLPPLTNPQSQQQSEMSEVNSTALVLAASQASEGEVGGARAAEESMPAPSIISSPGKTHRFDERKRMASLNAVLAVRYALVTFFSAFVIVQIVYNANR